MTRPPIRISASRLKTLNHCSLSFWYQEVMRLPSDSHHKTRQGVATHRVMELLMKPKRLARFKRLILDGFTEADHPPISRFIRVYAHYHRIAPYEMTAMLDMVRVAFLGLQPHFTTPDGQWAPPREWICERRFQLQIGDATISGLVDALLLWDDHAVIIDYKTQAKKFVISELPSNVQALIYQRAVRQELGMVPAVEFILLRHAPSKRYPKLHVQRVEPHSEAVLAGLGAYVEDTYQIVNGLTLERAMTGVTDDESFCQRLCPYLKPFSYLALVKRDDTGGPPIKTFLLDTKDVVCQSDEMLVERCHLGCHARGR